MRLLIFLLMLVVVSCNPAKRLQRKVEQAQKITDYVNTLTPIVKPDSVVYGKSITVTLRDTMHIPSMVAGSPDTIKIATFTNTRDTVTLIHRDYDRENMYYRQLVECRAGAEADTKISDNNEKYFRWSLTANLILLVVCGIMVAKILHI